jgi:Na+:H+ antiporter, NhaA family
MDSRFGDMFKKFFDSEKVAGLLLIICTLISLLIANSFFGSEYVHLFHDKIDLRISDISITTSVELVVNEGLMAIFFLMVGLEVERELYVGELADIKKAILPIAAAIGGMVVPALIHFLLNYNTSTRAGFAIPMATDIAFALGILALLGKRVPTSVKIFLTALAIIDDIGAILVIAFFYTKTIYFNYLLGAIGLLILLFALNRFKVKALSLYLIAGVVIWYLLLKSGVHSTLAGVLLAFVIPFHKKNEENISYKLQHILHKPVAFVILPIFALVNTAIILPDNIAQSLTTPNSIGIIAGLIAGKLLGIFLFPFVLVKFGLATLQTGITWRRLAGIGLLGGIGFTMSIFISSLSFSDYLMVSNSKLSVLTGSFFAAVFGLLVLATGKRYKNQ